MFKKIYFISLIVYVFLLGGCALTVDRIPLNYGISQNFSIPFSKTNKKLVVQDIKDTRSIPNPKYILQKRNSYGQLASGAFEAEEEIALIITEALRKVLEQNGYSLIGSNADYIIKGKLISIDEDYIMGLWSGNLKLKMLIELSLVDSLSQDAIWKETFVANGISKKTASTTTAIQTAFKDSVDDFLRQFVESDFIKKIK